MKLDKLKPGISIISFRSVYDFLLCSMLHYFVSLEDMIRRPYLIKSVNIFSISYYHSSLLFLHLFSSPHFPVQDTSQLYEIYKPFLAWSPLISPLSRKYLYPTPWYSPCQQFYSLLYPEKSQPEGLSSSHCLWFLYAYATAYGSLYKN